MHNVRDIQLSCDGVSESRSTSISLDVFSMKFKACRTIYPLRIIRPIKKTEHIDQYLQLDCVVRELHDNGCVIKEFIGDNPKRAIARMSLSHSSWFPCEYCFSKGIKLVVNNAEIMKKKKQIETQRHIIAAKIRESSGRELANLKNIEKELIESDKKLKPKKTNIVWPKTTANGPPRTREEILEIIEKIENDVPMTIDEAKGIQGRSILFDIPYYNFVLDTAVDYLHCVCLGVTKRCVELTFKVGDARPRVTKRPLSSPLLFNRLISSIKVFKEFNRRIRDLDFAVYKGQEFRNLVLFFFPLIINCIQEGAKERHMWLNLAYMIRSCVIPSEEFNLLSMNVINSSRDKFYSLYQTLFGARNCSYNTHVCGSHLLEMRPYGPLTLTSAFPFESFYGELRNCFVPGTVSPLKQIMSNVLIKRAISNHCCESGIYISEKDTPMECNSLVYTFENDQYQFYKVIQKNDDNLLCKNIDKLNCIFRETPHLNWGSVGVFKQGNVSEEILNISMSIVKGKLLKVNDLLLTCPLNVLREK